MTMTLTSALTRRLLLEEIRDFAVTAGWTATYDEIGTKGQLGLSKGACHVALGELRDNGDTTSTATTRSDLINGGTVSDEIIAATLNTALVGANTKYWGHTGGPSTNAASYQFNDLTGPFDDVWLFTDATGTYVHVVIRSAANRFSHISFGMIDKLGMTHADVGYLTGGFYEWWNNEATVNTAGYGPNGIAGVSVAHIHPYRRPRAINVPAGVHSGSFTFATGIVESGFLHSTWQTYNSREAHATTANTSARILDPAHFGTMDLTTGGLPLFGIPILQWDASLATMCYLGDFPGARMVPMDGKAGAESVTLGADTWHLFPLKQVGAEANAFGGSNPLPIVNTTHYGFAFKE